MFKCSCDKEYKTKGGLTRHKNKCNKTISPVKDNVIIEYKKDSSMDFKTKQIIKDCHNILYANGFNGEKVMNDLIRLIFLRINNKFIVKKCCNKELYKDMIEFGDIAETDVQYLDWNVLFMKLNDASDYKFLQTNLVSKNSNDIPIMRKIGRMLVKHPLTSKFFRTENWLNINDFEGVYKIMKLLNGISIESLAETDINGSIYEYIVNDYLKGSNQLGQFFTPRKLVKTMIDETTKLLHTKDIYSIYDPCMGTAGFLTESIKKYPNSLISGCEIAPDTLMYGMMNLMMYSNDNIDIKCENSLLLPDKKYDLILTNPPFGVEISNKDTLQKEFSIDNSLICSLVEGLFTIKCGLNLSDDGVCGIVLPYGQLFSASQLVGWRQYIIENFNIKKIVHNNAGIFEYTKIESAYMIFTKGKTEVVEFIDGLQNLKISINDIRKNYSLYINDYIIVEPRKTVEGIRYMRINDICDFLSKSKRKASEGGENGMYNFYTSSDKVKKCELADYMEESLIIGTGGNPNIKIDNKFSCSADNILIKSKTEEVLTKYLYYYLYTNIDILGKGFKGVTIKHINKEYIKNVEVPIPSIEKQIEIIEYFTSLEEETKLLKQRIQDNEELKNKYLMKMLSN